MNAGSRRMRRPWRLYCGHGWRLAAGACGLVISLVMLGATAGRAMATVEAPVLTAATGPDQPPAKPAESAAKPAEPATKPSITIRDGEVKVEPAPAAPTTQPVAEAGPYPVSKFELSYGRPHPSLPSLEPLMTEPLVLGKADKGYVAAGAGAPTVTLRLADLRGQKAEDFFASAIRSVNEQIVAAFNRQGLAGIFVAPQKDDVDSQTGKDLRQGGNTVLRLVVWSASVSRVRTLAAGERIPSEERIDHPKHKRILAGSPLKAGGLLDKEDLDRYVYFLNRHPGRRVDAAVSSGDQPGQVALDYLVSESKPWLAFAQASNTGTEATDEWRYRFGFIHNQLTNNDDILTGEYTTTCFDEPTAQSAAGSYEAPFLGMDRLRWRVFGSWGKYRANVPSGVGFGQDFDGHEWRLGGELIPNLWQRKDTFLDAVAGAYWWHVQVINKMIGQTGSANLFVPYVGLRLERISELATTLGSTTLDWNCPGIANSDREDLELLGRTDPDAHWMLLHWDFLQSFFLEPLLDPKGWRDVSRPEKATLAHEVAFQFRGQYAFSGYRMIPQAERVVGGFFSVRGYPESASAGDTVLIGTAEYRLHIPRLFKIQPEPGKTPLPLVGTPFRWAPQAVYGRPDWDLIFRTFFDVGRTMSSWRRSFESDDTLMGTGVGLELQFTRSINVRCDLGIPCRSLDMADQSIQGGQPRFHIVATVLY